MVQNKVEAASLEHLDAVEDYFADGLDLLAAARRAALGYRRYMARTGRFFPRLEVRAAGATTHYWLCNACIGLAATTFRAGR